MSPSKAQWVYCFIKWEYSASCWLSVLGWITVKMWKLYIALHDRLLAVVALALPTIMVNGIFQEEALFGAACTRHSACFQWAAAGTCISGTSARSRYGHVSDWTSKGHEQAISPMEVTIINASSLQSSC